MKQKNILTYAKHKYQYAFTLIELSIVLVIVGLVIGAVLVGKDLIEGAENLSQASQFEKYSTAVRAFQLKYNDLPGDMLQSNANSFGFSFKPDATYHSNGDGRYNQNVFPLNLSLTQTEELYNFWSELSEAGLIGSKYQMLGDWDPSIGAYLTYPGWMGKCLPPLKLNQQVGMMPSTIPIFGGNWWLTGETVVLYSHQNTVPSFTPLQAFQLDQKMDDGKPMTGIVRAVKVVAGTPSTYCVNNAGSCTYVDDNIAYQFYTPANCVTTGGTSYNTINTTINCKLAVKMQ